MSPAIPTRDAVTFVRTFHLPVLRPEHAGQADVPQVSLAGSVMGVKALEWSRGAGERAEIASEREPETGVGRGVKAPPYKFLD
jgi:hypothetical protein